MTQQPTDDDMALLERTLAYARGKTTAAEVFVSEGESTPVSFEAEKLKEISTRQTWGLGIRVFVNGRMGVSSTNDPNKAEELVDRAIELARYGPESELNLPEPSPNTPAIETYDPAIEEVTTEAMVDAGRRLLNDAKPLEPEALYGASLTHSTSRFAFLNSNGVSFGHRKSGFGLFVSGTLIRGTDMFFIGEGDRGCSPDWDMQRHIDGMRQQIKWGKEIAPTPAGHMPVLFMPRAVSSVLLGPFLSGINGKTVLQGSSPLGGRIGEQVFDSRLTIVDDPTLPLKPPSRSYDDEGVPSRRQFLVEDGVLRTILYELQSASKAGVEPTSSASRGLGAMPGAGTTHLSIKAGDASFDDMLRTMGDGVIVERLIGMGQGNVLGGDAGGNILLGYRVQGGEVVGRVKDTMLHCNIYDILKDITAIGAETTELGGSLSTPAILCDGVSIAPKSDSE